MSISSIFSNVPSASDPFGPLYAPASASSATGVSSTADADSSSTAPSTGSVSSAAASTSVSSGAQLLKELQDLQQSNPAEFKQATADIAAHLQAAAQQAGGSQGQALTNLAGKFQQASQTGSLSPLHSGHHGGHHHHGGGGLAAADSSAPTTPAASATSAAIAAYQQYTDQTSPLTSAAGQSISNAAALRSQVTSIIGQVLSQDLGGTAAGAVA